MLTIIIALLYAVQPIGLLILMREWERETFGVEMGYPVRDGEGL